MGRKLFFSLLAISILLLAGCSLFVTPPKADIQKDLNDILGVQGNATSSLPLQAQQPAQNDDVLVKTFTEGQLVEFPNLKAKDPDGNNVTIIYSKPLNSSGQWQTTYGDAGTYDTQISISDGNLLAAQKIRLVILKLNQPPVIKMPSEIKVKEGDTVELDPVVTDADNDSVTVTYDGWMTSKTKQTGYNDAGTYDVKITANDGMHNSTADVSVVVENVNRPPVFLPGSFD